MILSRSKNDRKRREKNTKMTENFPTLRFRVDSRRWNLSDLRARTGCQFRYFPIFEIMNFSDIFGQIFWHFGCNPQSNLTQISISKSIFWNEKSRPDRFQNEFVCEQVGVEPPLDKLFKIEFTKYQVQRKNQNIFELLKIFLFDTPLIWLNMKS